MPNMSYCRFQNTLLDLQDCKDNLFSKELSKQEREARTELVHLCYQIIEELGGSIEDEVDDLIIENFEDEYEQD